MFEQWKLYVGSSGAFGSPSDVALAGIATGEGSLHDFELMLHLQSRFPQVPWPLREAHLAEPAMGPLWQGQIVEASREERTLDNNDALREWQSHHPALLAGQLARMGAREPGLLCSRSPQPAELGVLRRHLSQRRPALWSRLAQWTLGDLSELQKLIGQLSGSLWLVACGESHPGETFAPSPQHPVQEGRYNELLLALLERSVELLLARGGAHRLALWPLEHRDPSSGGTGLSSFNQPHPTCPDGADTGGFEQPDEETGRAPLQPSCLRGYAPHMPALLARMAAQPLPGLEAQQRSPSELRLRRGQAEVLLVAGRASAYHRGLQGWSVLADAAAHYARQALSTGLDLPETSALLEALFPLANASGEPQRSHLCSAWLCRFLLHKARRLGWSEPTLEQMSSDWAHQHQLYHRRRWAHQQLFQWRTP